MRKKQQPSFKSRGSESGIIAAVTRYRDVITLVDHEGDDPRAN